MLSQDPLLDAPAEVADNAPAPGGLELRLVTVLAATPPAADDPEHHRQLLDETLASVRDVLERHGGALQRFGPEGLVAVFGADGPATTTPNARRWRPGARPAGGGRHRRGRSREREAWSTTGRRARPRAAEIRLDERTAGARPRRGRSTRRSWGAAGSSRNSAPRFAAVARPPCHVVTVVGEPGIGARLDPRARRSDGSGRDGARRAAAALTAREGRSSPCWALCAAPSRKALAGEEDGELVLARLGVLAGGEDGVPGRVVLGGGRLLESLATATRAAILDDVHWAEPALLDLVDYLGDRAAAPSARPPPPPAGARSPAGRSLELGPLGDEHALAIVQAGELDGETRERDRRAGRRERALRRAARIVRRGRWRRAPADAGGGARRPFRRTQTTRTRRTATGRRGRTRVLVRGRRRARGRRRRAQPALLSRAGFVHPAAAAGPGDDGYTFHHVLLRDAAYASLTKADRADLHERAAAWLDRDGPGDDALVGYHLEQAVRFHRELGEDADALRAKPRGGSGSAKRACGSGGQRRQLYGRAARHGRRLLPAGSGAPSCCWSMLSRARLHRERHPESGRRPRAEAETAGDAGPRP